MWSYCQRWKIRFGGYFHCANVCMWKSIGSIEIVCEMNVKAGSTESGTLRRVDINKAFHVWFSFCQSHLHTQCEMNSTPFIVIFNLEPYYNGVIMVYWKILKHRTIIRSVSTFGIVTAINSFLSVFGKNNRMHAYVRRRNDANRCE